VLAQAKQDENQLPDVFKNLQQERDAQARKALQMKKKLKPVNGSAGRHSRNRRGQPDSPTCDIGHPNPVEPVNSSLAISFVSTFKNTSI